MFPAHEKLLRKSEVQSVKTHFLHILLLNDHVQFSSAEKEYIKDAFRITCVNEKELNCIQFDIINNLYHTTRKELDMNYEKEE